MAEMWRPWHEGCKSLKTPKDTFVSPLAHYYCNTNPYRVPSLGGGGDFYKLETSKENELKNCRGTENVQDGAKPVQLAELTQRLSITSPKTASSISGSQHSMESRRSRRSAKGLREEMKSKCQFRESIQNIIDDANKYERDNLGSVDTPSAYSRSQAYTYRARSLLTHLPKINVTYDNRPRSTRTVAEKGVQAEAEDHDAAEEQKQIRSFDFAIDEKNINMEDYLHAKLISPMVMKNFHLNRQIANSQMEIMNSLEVMPKNIENLFKTVAVRKYHSDNNLQ